MGRHFADTHNIQKLGQHNRDKAVGREGLIRG